ncbi:hypothetical protein BDQ17DRAFT_1334023 [Cyathus striatus]|nr:hypothetical protein BDQ17DRAFT_1334023 [Cyathus striatus]
MKFFQSFKKASLLLAAAAYLASAAPTSIGSTNLTPQTSTAVGVESKATTPGVLPIYHILVASAYSSFIPSSLNPNNMKYFIATELLLSILFMTLLGAGALPTGYQESDTSHNIHSKVILDPDSAKLFGWR